MFFDDLLVGRLRITMMIVGEQILCRPAVLFFESDGRQAGSVISCHPQSAQIRYPRMVHYPRCLFAGHLGK